MSSTLFSSSISASDTMAASCCSWRVLAIAIATCILHVSCQDVSPFSPEICQETGSRLSPLSLLCEECEKPSLDGNGHAAQAVITSSYCLHHSSQCFVALSLQRPFALPDGGRPSLLSCSLTSNMPLIMLSLPCLYPSRELPINVHCSSTQFWRRPHFKDRPCMCM